MFRAKKFLIVFLVFLFSFVSLKGQKISETQTKTIARVENYLARMEKHGFSGSVLVEIDGKKILSRGYGFSDRNNNLKNTPETVFDIGSITKQFTGAAIIKLEMQGKLSVEDKLTKYFENVPPDKSRITIHDLLRHQTGLPSVVGGDFDAVSESEFLQKVFAAPLQFENGKKFSYSNVGYSLLGIIIEKVSGMSYEKYLYENLWKPAGMKNTGYTRPKFEVATVAVGYENESVWGRPNAKSWDKNAPFWHLKANGGILSTAEDLYLWHRALLKDRILSKEAKAKYFAPRLRPEETREGFYAYGWDVHLTPRRTKVIEHNGTNRVFYADFRRFVDENVTIIMLLNKADEKFNEVSFVLADMIFDPGFKPEFPPN